MLNVPPKVLHILYGNIKIVYMFVNALHIEAINANIIFEEHIYFFLNVHLFLI